MELSQFDFALPENLIAQQPAPTRDGARLMLVHRKSGAREHLTFRDLPDILGPEHFLVLNNTRVFPARLRAHRPGRDEHIEVLLVRETAPGIWTALLRPARKAPAGQELDFGRMTARVEEALPEGARVLRFNSAEDITECVDEIGETPLPPYIRRPAPARAPEDRDRYQTVYARHRGSVAAPTAGLQFTEEIFKSLKNKGIPVCEVLLHVGYGTFQPVREEQIECHRMHPEYYRVDAESAEAIAAYKGAGKSLVSVGTTSTRVLEYLAASGGIRESTGDCNLFIYPGFEFKAVDGLLTNFHLPKSTLFMLVCAFAGRDLMLDCYREAVAKKYRFFSYGDCMLLV